MTAPRHALLLLAARVARAAGALRVARVARVMTAAFVVAAITACGTAGHPGPDEAQAAVAPADPLPSWRDGASKQAVLSFVRRTTTPGGPDFVPPEERIATFDNDGTLWREDPVVEMSFVSWRAQERVRAQPALGEQSPYKEYLADPAAYFRSTGQAGAIRLLNTLYGDTSVESFQDDVRRYFAVARHPKSRAPIRMGIYQPMLELLALLRANGYQTWLCSGGTIDFMRAISQDFYGIPPQQVIGSRMAARFRENGNDNAVWREPKVESFNDMEFKPVNIALQIGKRPVFAAGNVGGKGDVAMLSYSQARRGPSFQLLVNHDDAKRESAYAEADGLSLRTAEARGWTVVSMQRDWTRVFNLPDPPPGPVLATPTAQPSAAPSVAPRIAPALAPTAASAGTSLSEGAPTHSSESAMATQ